MERAKAFGPENANTQQLHKIASHYTKRRVILAVIMFMQISDCTIKREREDSSSKQEIIAERSDAAERSLPGDCLLKTVIYAVRICLCAAFAVIRNQLPSVFRVQ